MSITTEKMLPQANGDFYAIGLTLSEEDQALLRRVRAFLEAEVAPLSRSIGFVKNFPTSSFLSWPP